MYVIDLQESSAKSLRETVGSKAYTMSMLIRNGVLVPSGVVLTADAYNCFLEYNTLNISNVVKKATKENLLAVSSTIKPQILSARMPEELKNMLRENMDKIRAPFTSVRSSVIGEKFLDMSSTGLHDSFIGIKTTATDKIITSVKKCYASLYNIEALFYRLEKEMELEGSMGVIIQEMIPSEKSGVIFSSFPAANTLMIEAYAGLGNIGGFSEVKPDTYIVEKVTGHIIDKKIRTKSLVAFLGNEGIRIARRKSEKNILTQDDIENLIETALELEEIFGAPQSIKWAISQNVLYVLQSRPFSHPPRYIAVDDMCSFSTEPVIEGRIAKPPLTPIPDQKYILLLDSSNPRYVPFLKRAKAVICGVGGILTHFAIVCRELGIPYFVIKDAYTKFDHGEYVKLRIKKEKYRSHRTRPDGWVRIMKYIPVPPEGPVQQNHTECVQNLPSLFHYNYKLRAEIRKDELCVASESLKRFTDDVRNDIDTLCKVLESSVNEDYDFSFAVLASFMIDPLFEELTNYTDLNTAFMLIRGIDPLYFSLKGNELYLIHFGNGLDKRIDIPSILRSKKAYLDRKYDKVTHNILNSLGDRKQKVKKLIKAIKLLESLYERKDKNY